MQLISPLAGVPQHPVTHEVKREKNSLRTNGTIAVVKNIFGRKLQSREKKLFSGYVINTLVLCT
jgi:hypothetical protein